MTRSDDLYSIPPDLPVPADDGACAHLRGMKLPPLELRSTRDRLVDLSALRGPTVVYAYQRTGLPDRDPLPGWDQIPGARGCTPQSWACELQLEDFPGLPEVQVSRVDADGGGRQVR